ncbi:polysaccharide deacetylase family protein [bacterium]|nr:polysaccharide deacetylase family protein [bacterium]
MFSLFISIGLSLASTNSDKEFVEEVPILMYHHVRIPPPQAKRLEKILTVTPSDFFQQMNALYQAGYRTISLNQLFEKKWEKRFIITFDDGYKDVIQEAYPILESFGFKATIFVITNEIGKPGHLDWWDIKFLESQGWEVGSHTVSHQNLCHLSMQNQWKEIYQSKVILEKALGHKVYFLSYPAGRFNEQVINLVKMAGYKGAVSTLPGRENKIEDIYKLKRVRVNGGTPLSYFMEKVLGNQAKRNTKISVSKLQRPTRSVSPLKSPSQ